MAGQIVGIEATVRGAKIYPVALMPEVFERRCAI
jgi:hypothetical protein